MNIMYFDSSILLCCDILFFFRRCEFIGKTYYYIYFNGSTREQCVWEWSRMYKLFVHISDAYEICV